jgi:hypothetical protein
LLVAAIVATRFSSNKVREHERQKATSTRGYSVKMSRRGLHHRSHRYETVPPWGSHRKRLFHGALTSTCLITKTYLITITF